MSDREPSAQVLRADAQRNRERILTVAAEAFAREGVEVSLAEIARRAGVGFATVQRRFATKDALISEIVRARIARLTHDRALSKTSSAWNDLASLIRTCCDQQAREPGLAGTLADFLSAALEPVTFDSVLGLLDPLIERAIAEQTMRYDVTVEDLLLIIMGNAGVISHSPGHEHEASRRYVEIALLGLRA